MSSTDPAGSSADVAEKLAAAVVEARAAELPDWSVTGELLQRTYGFDDFLAAMRFVNRVAELAEAEQHHPDILVRYNKVTLTLTTHDAGGLTDRDFKFAQVVG
jgi:4a-hydroxytetrahydrobiopterin dehydratase